MQVNAIKTNKRKRVVVRTSLIGIIINVLLVIFKTLMGIFSLSLALVIDAVNNLTDALSSLVTLISAKLASKTPDKKHPYGHGRIEYIAEMIVAALILTAGVLAIIESVKGFIVPSNPSYILAAYIVMGVSIAAKLALGIFARIMGKKVHSQVLISVGTDALFDALLTTSVLIGALVFYLSKVSIESYLGIVIGLFIIKSGISIIIDAANRLIGVRYDASLTKAIKKTVAEVPGVLGAYDLMLTDYGPERSLAQIHIEVDENLSAKELDILSREIQEEVYKKHSVFLTSVGVYAFDQTDPEVSSVRERCYEQVRSHVEVLGAHGFHLDKKRKNIFFDVVVSFNVKEREVFQGLLIHEIRELYPSYNVFITLDSDISD